MVWAAGCAAATVLKGRRCSTTATRTPASPLAAHARAQACCSFHLASSRPSGPVATAHELGVRSCFLSLKLAFRVRPAMSLPGPYHLSHGCPRASTSSALSVPFARLHPLALISPIKRSQPTCCRLMASQTCSSASARGSTHRTCVQTARWDKFSIATSHRRGFGQHSEHP